MQHAGEFSQFWLRYLRAHADPRTRALHYAGTLGALVCLGLAAARRDPRLLLAATAFRLWGRLDRPRADRGQPAGDIRSSRMVPFQRFPHARPVPDRQAAPASPARRLHATFRAAMSCCVRGRIRRVAASRGRRWSRIQIAGASFPSARESVNRSASRIEGNSRNIPLWWIVSI